MKRFAILLTVVVCCVFSAAAKVPDEDDILAHILDAESEYYYPSLMMRYMAGDTTLTDDHYHYLYYGYAYDPAYRPLEMTSGASDRILEIMAAAGDKTPDRQQAEQIAEAAAQVMMTDPFSPSNINFLTYACAIAGDTLQARINADRFEKILHTIESSGSGLRENDPRHVLLTSHAADVIAARGLEIQSRQVRTRSVEYIRLKEKDGKVKGYYYDFGRMYRKAPENAPKKEPGRWQLNGFPL